MPDTANPSSCCRALVLYLHHRCRKRIANAPSAKPNRPVVIAVNDVVDGSIVELFGRRFHPLTSRLSEVLPNKVGIKKVNPITYVDDADPPVLIIHGTDDRTVPLNQSEAMHQALNSAGVESTLYTIEGAGHGGPVFAQPEIRNMQRESLLKQMKKASETATPAGKN